MNPRHALMSDISYAPLPPAEGRVRDTAMGRALFFWEVPFFHWNMSIICMDFSTF